ncbi:MAG TPA: peptidylprolyl isomerase [Blastocatellia bacterium]|nr:peptidylprolyl isomerase [Blastocatellia bacterium]
MKLRAFLFAFMISVGAVGFWGCKGSAANDQVAVLETSYGRIVIEFFPEDAPKNVANFKNLVAEGFYDGTKFHRLVRTSKGPVAIQGGDPNTINGDPSTWGQGQPGQPTVPGEFSARLKHVRGIVSEARKSGDVNSGTSQFFICTGSEPQWDGQYSIFGHVIEGMNVVDTIANAPVWPTNPPEKPRDPVVVKHAYLTKRSELK